MPTIRWGLELDSSGFRRELEDAQEQFERSVERQKQLTSEIENLQQRRERALIARSTPDDQLAALLGVDPSNSNNVLGNALRDLEESLSAASTKRLATLERQRVASDDRVIASSKKITRVLEDEEARRLSFQRRSLAEQEAIRTRTIALGATQVARAAGVPIPAGAELLSLGARAAGPVIAIGAAVATVAAARAAITSTSEWIDTMRELARQTGATTEAVSQWAVAVERQGGNVRSLSSATDALQKSIQQNPAQFKALGIALREVNGEARPILEVLKDVQRVMSQARDGADRNRLGIELLGPAYRDLHGIFDVTTEKFDALMEAAAGSARIIDSEAVAANERYKESLRAIEAQAEELKQRGGGALAAFFVEASDLARQYFDTLGTFLNDPKLRGNVVGSIAAGFGRVAERRQGLADQANPSGTEDVGGALAANLDPAIVAFQRLDDEARKAFSSIAAESRVALSSIDGLEERFTALFRGGLITSEHQRALVVAQQLGLSSEQISNIFAAATNTVNIGMDQLGETIRQRQVANFSDFLSEMIVGNARRELDSLNDRIASIDEQLLRISERRREVATFDPGALSEELRAREEERVFVPTRPQADASEDRALGRLQKERAELVAKRDELAIDVANKEKNLKLAQDQVTASEELRKAEDAARIAARERSLELRTRLNEEKIALVELRAEYKGLAADAGRAVAPEKLDRPDIKEHTFRILVDILNSDGSLKAADMAMLRQIFGEEFEEVIRRAMGLVRAGGAGGGLLK